MLIASDLPLQGAGDAAPRAMADAIRAVLSEHGFRAGKYTVGYRSCDDSTRADRRRSSTGAAPRTRTPTRTPTRLVAVIGPYNSGCAQVQIPILNRAPGGPLAMISPTNTGAWASRARARRRRDGVPRTSRTSTTPSAPATTSA